MEHLSQFMLGIAAVTGLLFAGLNWRMAHQKMMKELFTEFNQRYNELNDFLLEIKQNTSLEDLRRNDVKLYEKLNDYLNLCAEEYFWYKKKRISKEIWLAWNQGMKDWYATLRSLRELWEEENKKSYYLKEREDFFK